MFSPFALVLLSLLLITLSSVHASPILKPKPVTLPFAHKLKALTRGKTIPQMDRARIKAIVASAAATTSSKASSSTHKTTSTKASTTKASTTSTVSATPTAKVGAISAKNGGVEYTMSIGIGTPATQYTLLMDTGSSNTWIGSGGKAYTKTSTSSAQNKSFSVTYGSGSVAGTMYKDTVTVGALVLKDQYIGVASSSSGFDDTNGILGLGPTSLTEGTVVGMNHVTTVTDNLFGKGIIPQDELGVFFAPVGNSTSTEGGVGELSFGGYDASKIVGSVVYAPLVTTGTADEYWGYEQSMMYGTEEILSSTEGILDTGTTLIQIATDAYNKYVSATGAVVDTPSGFLKITTAQYALLKPLTFTIGGQNLVLTPNGQIWPRQLNAILNSQDTASVYLVIADIGSESGSGLDFVNGYTFLERFYSIYDTTHQRIGLANTAYTNSNAN